MSKLPQTDELPHADEGFDPARVEEAFATFANRVRELESVASELRAELEGPLAAALHALLTRREVVATVRRVDRLLETRRFPEPSGDWPAVPWPPW